MAIVIAMKDKNDEHPIVAWWVTCLITPAGRSFPGGTVPRTEIWRVGETEKKTKQHVCGTPGP